MFDEVLSGMTHRFILVKLREQLAPTGLIIPGVHCYESTHYLNIISLGAVHNLWHGGVIMILIEKHVQRQ